MKKYFGLILLVLLILTAGICSAQTANEDAEEPVIIDHIVVGNPTPMQGNFFTEMWGNATSDIDVRSLIHGYNLVRWDGEEGVFALDPSVVKSITVLENEAGDRSCLLTLHDDLYYSDGSKITAWDYTFSFLLQIAPEIREIGGKPLQKSFLSGYDAYVRGETKQLAGVRVPADDTLMITISHESLPFFYEMGLLMCAPFPIHVIAPGVEVRDDGEGVYLANIDDSLKEPEFRAELLRQTILDPERGYRSHPSVTCGPYVLSSWDEESRTAQLVRNPYYIGDAKGNKPQIQWITYMTADNEDMIEKLKNADFDLLNKVTQSETIMAGQKLMGEGGFSMSNYPRVGLSFISFRMVNPAVSSRAVRQAIA